MRRDRDAPRRIGGSRDDGTGSAASDLGWLRLHLPEDGSVEVTDVTERHAVVSLWGPIRGGRSPRRAGRPVHPSFPYLTSRVIDVAGVEVRANRVSFAGELGYELVVAADSAGRVWDAVLAAGREFGIEPVGYYALNMRSASRSASTTGGTTSARRHAPRGEPRLRAVRQARLHRPGCLASPASGQARAAARPPRPRRGEPACSGAGNRVAAGRVVGRVRSGGYGHTLGHNVARLPPGGAGAAGHGGLGGVVRAARAGGGRTAPLGSQGRACAGLTIPGVPGRTAPRPAGARRPARRPPRLARRGARACRGLRPAAPRRRPGRADPAVPADRGG